MTQQAKQITAGAWADRYRDKWKWDKVTWGSHAVDCYPGGCPWRVYTVTASSSARSKRAISCPFRPASRT